MKNKTRKENAIYEADACRTFLKSDKTINEQDREELYRLIGELSSYVTQDIIKERTNEK
jgi:hypothetical protein